MGFGFRVLGLGFRVLGLTLPESDADYEDHMKGVAVNEEQQCSSMNFEGFCKESMKGPF